MPYTHRYAYPDHDKEGPMNSALRRLDELCAQAQEDEETINPQSLANARAFFAAITIEIDRPKITLTPDGTIRAHWPWGLMREF